MTPWTKWRYTCGRPLALGLPPIVFSILVVVVVIVAALRL
jgi:hypothetical protein